MAARKRKSTRKRGRVVDDALARLERELPRNLATVVAQVRRRLGELEKQLDRARSELEKARAQGERRLARIENQLRSEAVKQMKRLEKAVAPKKKTRRKTKRKTARRKTSAASSGSSSATSSAG